MPAEQCVGYRAGLFVNLLPHEPVVATLLGCGEIPVNVVGLYLGGLPVERDDLDPVRSDTDPLILAKFNGLASVLDERGDIGCDEVFALPHADNERGVAARRDDRVRQL